MVLNRNSEVSLSDCTFILFLLAVTVVVVTKKGKLNEVLPFTFVSFMSHFHQPVNDWPLAWKHSWLPLILVDQVLWKVDQFYRHFNDCGFWSVLVKSSQKQFLLVNSQLPHFTTNKFCWFSLSVVSKHYFGCNQKY